jgi:hypothetical protein
MNQINTLPSCFFKVQFNIILPSTLRSSNWAVSLRFVHQNCLCIYYYSHSFYVPSACFNIYLMTLMMFCKYFKPESLHYALHVVCLYLKLSTVRKVTLSNEHRLRLPFNVRVQFPHSHKITDRAIALCFLIFAYFGSKLEDKIFWL